MAKLLLALLATLATAASTTADDAQVCLVQLEEGEKMHKEIAGMAMKCLAAPDTETHRLRDAETPEETQAFFKDYCENVTDHRACLSEVTATSRVCQNETRHQVLLIFQELLETVLGTACSNEGRLLATAFHGYLHRSDQDEDGPLQTCLNDGLFRLKVAIDNGDLSPAALLYVFYDEMVTLRDCVKLNSCGEDAVVEAVQTFLNVAVDSMKCVHPGDGSSVLCSSLDLGSISGAGYCPVIREEDDHRPMDELILERMKMCMRKVHAEDEKFEDIQDVDGYRNFSKKYCDRPETCITTAVVTSAACQSRGAHAVFKVVAHLVKGAVEGLCLSRGEPLAGFLEHVVRGGHLEGCGHALMTSLRAPAEGVHVQRAVHTQLLAFKRCLLEKLRGDNRAVLHAHHLSNALLRSMECLDPQSGGAVPCQDPATLDTVCPYEAAGEADHAAYVTLTDVAIACLKVQGPDFRRLGDESSLADYRSVFSEYCANPIIVASCLKDVSAVAQVCAPEDDQRLLQINTDLMVNALRMGCREDGRSLAATSYLMRHHAEELAPCKAVTEQSLAILSGPGNTTEVSVGLFHALNRFVQCVDSSLPGEGEAKTAGVAFLTHTLKSLQCVDHEGKLVLCESIVNDLHAA